MNKMPFEITAKQEGKTANIRLLGEIGWDVDSNTFQQQIDQLVADGCTSAHLYINSPGGNVFDAAEIANILSVFKGNMTGEGGALVASAATYLACQCKTFTMPENGQFMTHKPRGYVSGTSNAVRAYLKLLEDVEHYYFNAYMALAKDKESFEQKWNEGDNWMTAKEAMEAGFITGVKEKVKIDRNTAAMIKACVEGTPYNNTEIQTKNNEKMELKTTALLLGLDENAGEEQVKAKIQEGVQAISDLKALREKIADEEAAEAAAKVKSTLDDLITKKVITADTRQKWEERLKNNFDATMDVLNELTPIAPLSGGMKGERGDKTQATYNGKTFEQLQEKDPETLAELMKNDIETYNALYDSYLKRNKLK